MEEQINLIDVDILKWLASDHCLIVHLQGDVWAIPVALIAIQRAKMNHDGDPHFHSSINKSLKNTLLYFAKSRHIISWFENYMMWSSIDLEFYAQKMGDRKVDSCNGNDRLKTCFKKIEEIQGLGLSKKEALLLTFFNNFTNDSCYDHDEYNSYYSSIGGSDEK